MGSLSSSQRQFVILNAKKNVLVEAGKKRKRSMEEDDLLKTLQNKIKHGKRDMQDFDQRLVIKIPGKSDNERKRMERMKQSEEKVEKEKADARVRMVAHRAGGISDARRVDVRAGRKKNQGSSVYSGDALRNQEILDGTFIVDQLGEGTPDYLGALGTSQCSFCGALKCFRIGNIFLWFFINWICTFGSGGEARPTLQCAALVAESTCRAFPRLLLS